MIKRAGAVLLLLVAVSGCHRANRSAPAKRTVASGSPDETDAGRFEGPLVVGPRRVTVVIYFADSIPPALIEEAQSETRRRFPGMAVEGSIDAKGAPPIARVFSPARSAWSPPTETELRLFGRGLDPAQMAAAAHAKAALVLSFELSSDVSLVGLRDVQRLAAELGGTRDAWVWDEATREIYTREAWRAKRIEGWEDAIPYVQRHITIHYYETDGGRHRAITLGMMKFGLPDMVVDDVPLHQSSAVTTLIDAIAQEMVEGTALLPGGVLPIDLQTVRHVAARAASLAASEKDAARRGQVTLVPATPEEGDPDNRLVALRFPSYPGHSASERQAAALAAITGTVHDAVTRARESDPQLAAIKARVQSRLPTVATAFRAGLPPGEHITVKAPFTMKDEAVEWMWLEVSEWRATTVRGTLMNSPVGATTLRLGAKVEVPRESIADYVWMGADGGKKEGGESVELLSGRE